MISGWSREGSHQAQYGSHYAKYGIPGVMTHIQHTPRIQTLFAFPRSGEGGEVLAIQIDSNLESMPPSFLILTLTPSPNTGGKRNGDYLTELSARPPAKCLMASAVCP